MNDWKDYWAVRSAGTCVAGALFALTFCAIAGAHPTDQELEEAWQDRQRCSSETAWAERVDPVRLGGTEAELRAQFEDLEESSGPEAFADRDRGRLLALERTARPPLARVRYELWQNVIYRIRWRLAPDFERPVVDEFVRRSTACFGRPVYDQTFEAEPGSSAATLRRVGWKHADRRIELRQLHPLSGGPVYLSVSSDSALRELGVAGLAPFSEPTQTGSWWRRSARAFVPVVEEERKRLGDAYMIVVSELDH